MNIFVFLYIRSQRGNQAEEERNGISQERDLCKKDKSALNEEKNRLKKDISDGHLLAESSKTHITGLQNEIVRMYFRK